MSTFLRYQLLCIGLAFVFPYFLIKAIGKSAGNPNAKPDLKYTILSCFIFGLMVYYLVAQIGSI